MTFEEGFINDTIKRLKGYKELGDKTLAQLDSEDLNFSPNEESNSIATIIQHMHGNMLSRFTNFLTEDGEKPWRKRDAEFDKNHLPKNNILALWEEGWQAVMQALQGLQPGDLMKTIYIRTEPLLVYDAILRQLAHYPYHVGQIIYIGKLRTGKSWQPLSIAKGQSEQYNKELEQKLKTT